MATVNDIIAWAHTLPLWQGDFVRRILIVGEKPLDTRDCSDILALAKAELKLASPPDNVKPVPPACGVLCRYLSRHTPGSNR